MHEPITTSQITTHGIIAFFGAVVHATKAHRSGESKSLIDFAMLMIMSSFSGMMFALVGLHYFPHDIYVSTAMAGAGGFLGVEGLGIVIERIQSLLTKK